MKNNRRKLLKAITLGGGAATAWKLPADWSKPIVESVTLPAHAQTTNEDIGPNLPNILGTGHTDLMQPASLLKEPGLLDALGQPAYAAPGFNYFSVCVRVDRVARTFDIFLIISNNNTFYSYRGNNLDVGGDLHSLTYEGECVQEVSPGNAFSASGTVSDFNNNGATIVVMFTVQQRWDGFVPWNAISCGLDCESLQLPDVLL